MTSVFNIQSLKHLAMPPPDITLEGNHEGQNSNQITRKGREIQMNGGVFKLRGLFHSNTRAGRLLGEGARGEGSGRELGDGRGERRAGKEGE